MPPQMTQSMNPVVSDDAQWVTETSGDHANSETAISTTNLKLTVSEEVGNHTELPTDTPWVTETSADLRSSWDLSKEFADSIVSRDLSKPDEGKEAARYETLRILCSSAHSEDSHVDSNSSFFAALRRNHFI